MIGRQGQAHRPYQHASFMSLGYTRDKAMHMYTEVSKATVLWAHKAKLCLWDIKLLFSTK